MTAAVALTPRSAWSAGSVLPVEEAERRELAAQDAERAAWVAWEAAYGEVEAARAEYVRALRRER